MYLQKNTPTWERTLPIGKNTFEKGFVFEVCLDSPQQSAECLFGWDHFPNGDFD